MSIRPFRDIKRRKTKEINVGKVKVGGNNPISVQSMTNTLTSDIKATINQINEINSEGADIVRVSCPDELSTKSLKEIIKHVDVPIVADIHFHYKRAVEAAEMGASCLRINPGNIGTKQKILEVIKAAKSNNCSISSSSSKVTTQLSCFFKALIFFFNCLTALTFFAKVIFSSFLKVVLSALLVITVDSFSPFSSTFEISNF